MTEIALGAAERQQLAAFVDSRPAGTPYRRRATILLLADDGEEPATIGPLVDLPARQVRLLLRAFRQQGMALFPRWVLREAAPYTPDDAMAEAGRIALARQLTILRTHAGSLRAEAGVEAVHETRKAIRRTRTLLKMLAPYYEAGAFHPYRRCLKKLMRRLGRARDLHVFLKGLALYRAEATLAPATAEALAVLATGWQPKLEEAEAEARRAAHRPAYRSCLEAYQTFVETPGAGVAGAEPFTPGQVRHQATVHVYRCLAAVRAFTEVRDQATVATLHQLRIRFKELRYTLEFFAPVLDPEIESVLADLNQIQDHLGDLNDARVALALLDELAGPQAGVAHYRAVQTAQLERLVTTFGPVWEAFDDLTWRQRLATALVVL